MNAVNVALICSIPILAIFGPVVREKANTFAFPTYFYTAYEGDGILIGDTQADATLWSPFISINWEFSQKPSFGESHHTISIFVVRKSEAPLFLYRFDSNYTSPDYFFVEGGFQSVTMGQQHLDIRQYIYLLPKEYTPGVQATAMCDFSVKKPSTFSGRNETYGYATCQFQNNQQYRDFVDMEPGAIEKRTKCYCNFQAPTPCNDTTDCVSNTMPSDACYDSGDPSGPYFTAAENSYNFFSPIVPTNSYVKIEANITMYFYSYDKLVENMNIISEYKCTIRDIDTCSFTTTQLYWTNPERLLIIAYIHPKYEPNSFTTTVVVKAGHSLPLKFAQLLVYLLIPSFLIRTLLF